MDGTTLHGSATAADAVISLLAALDHAHGAVLGQVAVGAKTNEIPMFPVLCDRIEIGGAVITADAMHAQRGHAITWQARRASRSPSSAQPGLSPARSLPWRQIPVAHDARERGHGRDEHRTLKITSVAAGLAFPHAAQAIQIVRRRKLPGKKNGPARPSTRSPR